MSAERPRIEHAHDHACDCASHRRLAPPTKSSAPRATERATDASRDTEAPAPSLLASVLPALACAVCPACIATYASALSAVGVTASFGEAYHHYFLGVAVLVTLAVQAHRAHRTKRLAPLAIAALGCTLLVAGHALYESPLLLGAGVAVLLGGSIADVVAMRRRAARATAGVAPEGAAAP